MSLVLLCLSVACVSTLPEISTKQLGAPASDLLNGRLRSPDPLSVGQPSEHALMAFETNEAGAWEGRVSVPPTHHLSILPIGAGCETWDVIIEDPTGKQDAPEWVWTQDTLEPLLPQVATRLDVADPLAGSWTIRITNAQPQAKGYVVIRDRLGVGLHLRPENAATLLGVPIDMQAALVIPGNRREPLADAVHALASGYDVT